MAYYLFFLIKLPIASLRLAIHLTEFAPQGQKKCPGQSRIRLGARAIAQLVIDLVVGSNMVNSFMATGIGSEAEDRLRHIASGGVQSRQRQSGQECPMSLGFERRHPGGMVDNSPALKQISRRTS
jgi:hypothetical protein